MRCIVGEIQTQLLLTFDDREPTAEDNDYTGDFSFPEGQEQQVIDCVTQIAEAVNAFGKPPPQPSQPAEVNIQVTETGDVVVRVNGTEVSYG